MTAKKYMNTIFIALFAFIFVMNTVPFAQALDLAMPKPGSPVFGNNQYYSVLFDGEGDAIVAAKLVIFNPSEVLSFRELPTIWTTRPFRKSIQGLKHITLP